MKFIFVDLYLSICLFFFSIDCNQRIHTNVPLSPTSQSGRLLLLLKHKNKRKFPFPPSFKKKKQSRFPSLSKPRRRPLSWIFPENNEDFSFWKTLAECLIPFPLLISFPIKLRAGQGSNQRSASLFFFNSFPLTEVILKRVFGMSITQLHKKKFEKIIIQKKRQKVFSSSVERTRRRP